MISLKPVEMGGCSNPYNLLRSSYVHFEHKKLMTILTSSLLAVGRLFLSFVLFKNVVLVCYIHSVSCDFLCNLWLHCRDLPRTKRIEMFILKQTSSLKISKDRHESKCVPYGETTTQVEERTARCLPTVCTWNSHRLSEEWRKPGHGVLSALMMRNLGPFCSRAQLWHWNTYGLTRPSFPMTRMDGTSVMLTIHSNLIRWFYWANAIISLTLGYLPQRAKVESSSFG